METGTLLIIALFVLTVIIAGVVMLVVGLGILVCADRLCKEDGEELFELGDEDSVKKSECNNPTTLI